MSNIINEIFTMKQIEEISEICDSFEITDNNMRADEIISILESYDFEELGCGTNRICVAKEGYPYAIKIALDTRGIKDNNIEYALSEEDALKGLVTSNYENSGLILLAERVQIMTSEDFEYFRKDIFQIYENLSPIYLLNDIGPRSFRNWGIKDDKPIITDYAYLSKVKEAKLKRCDKCEGKLKYIEDFTHMQCKECGKVFTLADIKGDSYIDSMVENGWVVSDLNDKEKSLNKEDEGWI